MDVAGTVGEPHHQAATPTINNVGEFDFAGDHRLHARAQPPDGRDAGAVLIAMRQVEQHVLDRGEAETRELFPDLRPNAFQNGNGKCGDIHITV